MFIFRKKTTRKHHLARAFFCLKARDFFGLFCMVDFMGETWALFINVVYSAMSKILSGLGPTLAQIWKIIGQETKIMVHRLNWLLTRAHARSFTFITSTGRWINPRRSSGPRNDFGVGGRWLGNLTPQHGRVELEHRLALHSHRQEVCQHCKN